MHNGILLPKYVDELVFQYVLQPNDIILLYVLTISILSTAAPLDNKISTIFK